MLWERAINVSLVASKFVSILSTRRQTYIHADEEGHVFWNIKIMFAAPQFALIPLTLLLNVFIIKFYLDDVGVSAAFIAFFQIFSRSFDVLTDPLMAHISDNMTHTRLGRRIPYMMLCPLYAVAFFILVSPPDDPEDAAYWFGGSYLFFYFCDTLINVPFQALGPELTDDSDERASLYMYVKVAEGIGVMVGTLTPGMLEDYFTNKFIYQSIAVVFGAVYVLTMYILIKNVKERPASLAEASVRQPFVTSMYRSMGNAAFRPLIVGWILDFAAYAFIATMIPFYVTYYVEVDEMKSPFCDESTLEDGEDCYLSSGKHFGYCMACFFVSGFCSIPIWKYISRHDRTSDTWWDRIKIGKVQAWVTMNAVTVVTNVMYVIVPERGLYYLYLCMIINGIPVGGQFLVSAILADVIDYDEFLNYKRNEGQFTVFGTFVPKIIAIPCQSFPLVGMFLLGYTNPGTDESGDLIFQPQNAEVKWFIRLLFSFAPLVLTSCSFMVKRLYPIKSYNAILEISEGITLHLQGQSALDPVTNQEVWIEEHSDETQYLIYLLDQFSHSSLLWLLSPEMIWKRHQENKLPLRRNTLLHINSLGSFQSDEILHGDADEDDGGIQTARNKKSATEVIDNDEQTHPRTNAHGCCSCFDTKIHLATITKTRNDVEFGKDDDGNIVYVAVAGLEAHGVAEGIRRIKSRVALWITFYIVMWLVSVIGVGSTWNLLRDETLAFLPAIFCLTIGLSLVGAGFNTLRYRAANEIKEYIKEHQISEEVLAKCIYPKTKGQYGGSIMSEGQLDVMNQLLPEHEANPIQMKSLRDVDQLFVNTSISNNPFQNSKNASASDLISGS